MKFERLIVIASLLLVSVTVEAASLGRLTVISDLDQPLIAEIDLLGVNASELTSYSAQLASEQAYRIQGIEKTPPQNSIRVEVIRKFDNTPVLKLTSSQTLHSSAMNILIQLDWPNGRVMREYALLLEPSKVANSTSAPIDSVVFTRNHAAAADIAPQAPIKQEAIPAPSAAKAPEPAKPADVKSAAVASEREGDGYTTAKGDTLSKIAARMQLDGVSLDQMLQALYLANKDAFIDGDMNKLRAGVELKPPAAAEFAAVTAQSEDWRSYRNKVATLAAEAPAREDGTAKLPEAGKLAKVEDKAAPSAQAARDVLKLSRTDLIDEKWLSREAQFEEEKQALEEEVTVRENRLEDANQRIAELEKQVRDMTLLLKQSHQALAEQQARQSPWSFTSSLREMLRKPSDGLLAGIALAGLLLLIFLLRVFSGRRSAAFERQEPKI